jgi:hypothetical protein
LLIVVLVVAATTGITTWTFAQTAPDAPIVVTGSDIGFRIDRQRTRDTGKLTGTWVVRFNNQWVEPEAGSRTLPLSTR